MDVTPATPQLLPGERLLERSKFAMGVDLGQSSDPTAICVIEHHTADAIRERGPAHQLGACRRLAESFDVRHLQRLPLGLSYTEQAHEVRQLLARPPLAGACELVIDESGVGRPVGDLFADMGMEPTRVSITAGSDQHWHGPERWTVAKSLLISALDARLHTGELRFARDLREAGAMAEELRDFRRKVSAAGRFQYEARVGRHDDLVLAVAIALWFFVTRPAPASPVFTTYTLGLSAGPSHDPSAAFPQHRSPP